MDKYCRVCWNTRNWRMPSGDARYYEHGGSYVAENGFGHEEWLFNFEWLLSGFHLGDPEFYRYGFLQPIHKFVENYIGDVMNIFLYTFDPQGRRLAVAVINQAIVPGREEMTWVQDQVRRRGWLDIMREQIIDLGESGAPLQNPELFAIANVRFRLQDVVFFPPQTVLTPNHKVYSLNRYHPLNWDDGFVPTFAPVYPEIEPRFDDADSTPDRSELTRLRAAQPAVVYDPQHSILQNRLRDYLKKQYGQSCVFMEKEAVDLRIIEPNRTTFIEIKMEKSVRMCVRVALGQLLEYTHYPNQNKADIFLVVGDATPTENDVIYLKYLRKTYQIPVYYADWDQTNGELNPRV